jgi:hypothetical protein
MRLSEYGFVSSTRVQALQFRRREVFRGCLRQKKVISSSCDSEEVFKIRLHQHPPMDLENVT